MKTQTLFVTLALVYVCTDYKADIPHCMSVGRLRTTTYALLAVLRPNIFKQLELAKLKNCTALASSATHHLPNSELLPRLMEVCPKC